MVHLWEVVGIRYESFSNKAVYIICLAFNPDIQIAMDIIFASKSPMGRVRTALWEVHAAVLSDPHIQFRVMLYPHGTTPSLTSNFDLSKSAQVSASMSMVLECLLMTLVVSKMPTP